MNQRGFSELEFAAKKKRTRRERFLDQIEAATLWALLVEQIEPFYPKGERGRPPIGVERMLHTIIQNEIEWMCHTAPSSVSLLTTFQPN